MYDKSFFDGLGSMFAVMGCLAVIGAAAVIGGLAWAAYWAFTHLSIQFN